ncbi:MAG: DUF2147 domain-containing protein [Caulobacteraceae bacterium]
MCGLRKRASANAAAIVFAVALGAGAFAGEARAQGTQSIHDDWATRGIGGIVRLSSCPSDAALLCGRLTWVWDPSEVQRGAVGSLILRDFVRNGATWRGGSVLNPEDGRTYRGSISLDGDVLRLRGCAGPFCQTQVWRRLSSIPRP